MSVDQSDVLYFAAMLIAVAAAGGVSFGTLNLLALAVAFIAGGLLLDR